MKQLFLFVLTALFSMSLSGQSLPLSVEIGGGLGAGWWVYNKGVTDTLPHFHQGYDRTHLSFLWMSDIALTYTGENWVLGLGVGSQNLADDQMVGSENRRGGFRKYTISEEGRTGIPIRHFFLQGRWFLFQKTNMSLSMNAKIGSFLMTHAHPRKHTFGLAVSQEIGIVHLFHLSPTVDFFWRPQFANFRIGTEGGFEGERHNIYTLSATMGLRVGISD